MPANRPYTEQEIQEINARYPGIEWVNGQPFTRIQVPASEISGYDASGNPIDYLGNPVEMVEEIVPAHTDEGGLPWWFLAAQMAGPGVAAGLGAGVGAGAASAGASGGAAAPAFTTPLLSASTLPGAAAAGWGTGLTGATAAGTAAGGLGTSLGTGGATTATAAPAAAPAANAGGGGGLTGFLNSGVGRSLVQTGLGAAMGALTPDEETGPFRFSEVEGERGRLVSPENSLYNLTRTLMGLQLGLSRSLQDGYKSTTPMPGKTSSIEVPGLPFQLGGVGQNSSAFSQGTPGLDFTTSDGRNHLPGFLEDLLRPPTAPEVTPVAPQAGAQSAMVPNSNQAQVRPRGGTRRRSPR